MGVHVADADFFPQGEGTTAKPLKVRLHFGDESIDESPEMTRAIFRTLVGYRKANNRSSFDLDFQAWMDDEASSEANGFQEEFTDAAWAAL